MTPLHTLILPNRHIADYFELEPAERSAIDDLLEETRRGILARDPEVAGFNIGVNIGAVAGQTILHCHVHLIPRRPGDVANPRGGVRAVIPGKADYRLIASVVDLGRDGTRLSAGMEFPSNRP